MSYCTRLDVERIYGRDNIEKWADLDNKKDWVAIESAITGAITDEAEQLESEIVLGYYAVPFILPYPLTIIRMNALGAGLKLYDGRQVVTDNKDLCSRQRKQRDTIRDSILNGRLRLINPVTKVPLDIQSYGAPFIVLGDVNEVVVRLDTIGLE